MQKKIIHAFVLSCKQATFLIEKRLHTNLSPLEKLQLRVHLALCELCAAYNKKAYFLNEVMKKVIRKKEHRYQFYSDEVERFKEKIKEKKKKLDAEL